MKCNPERFWNVKPLINKCNWEEINYLSKIDDWKTLRKNNLIIALNILYIKEKETLSGYTSKHISIREKQIILLMIPDEENKELHYLAVKKLSTLLLRKPSKHKGDLYCLNCLNSFRT